ncbi:MAG: hypothetical protein JSV65_14065 [Armatimonadota bacterium]|nr:MAG: hypothetical protein JSV65_14065 [Armatimonadota bacterium]
MESDVHSQARNRARGVTWRSLLVAAVLMPVNAYWLVQMEIVRYSAHPTTISLLFNVVFIILVLTLANAGLRRLWPRAALTQGELLVIYAMLAISSVIAGHDGVQVLAPSLAWPTEFSTPENRWERLFGHHLRSWLMVQDDTALAGYFKGNSTMYTRRVIMAWLVPVLSWTGFIVLLLWVMLCINAILRRQWSEHERLTYPLAQIPLEITNPVGALFRSRLFWIGFGLAASVDTLNSFSFLYPAIPHIRIEQYDLNQHIHTHPWTAVGWMPISFYPFVIGIGVLIPLDFLFSCWFFYLFWKAELVLTRAFGFDRTPDFPFVNSQAFGAYMAFAIFAIWIGRGYLKQVLNKILGRPSTLDDSREAMSYRSAAAGAAVGLAGLILFSRYAGMSLWVAIAFFVIYFALALAVTRMRAEFGTPVHDLHFTGPDWTMPVVTGQRFFSGSDLTVMSLYFWFNRAYRSHPMPHQLEGMYMTGRVGVARRSFSWALMIAAALGTLCAFWAMLHLMYSYGAQGKSRMSFGAEGWNRLASWLESPQPAKWGATVAIGVGFVLAYLLELARVRWAAWPFHPLGFAVSGSWEMNLVWMPLFVAWLAKSILLRYGGLRLFRQSLPFFFGLILGQFVVGSILNIVSIVRGIPSYMFWQ